MVVAARASETSGKLQLDYTALQPTTQPAILQKSGSVLHVIWNMALATDKELVSESVLYLN
jgi:hypothetical protein